MRHLNDAVTHQIHGQLGKHATIEQISLQEMLEGRMAQAEERHSHQLYSMQEK